MVGTQAPASDHNNTAQPGFVSPVLDECPEKSVLLDGCIGLKPSGIGYPPGCLRAEPLAEVLALIREDAARADKRTAAWCEHWKVGGENLTLNLLVALDIGWLEMPFPVWIPTPNARATARQIEQQPIGAPRKTLDNLS
jgi:hypothetical protein